MAAPSFSVAGLFAGIGGIERGLACAGGDTELLCEVWGPAASVLSARFPDVPLVGDVADLDTLPDVDVVTAGFPCTDLSQAGRTAGIGGAASGLVSEVFRLLRHRRVEMLVLENVRNMLVLDRGDAMRYLVDSLEALGYRWAYRLVDSRFTGVPQRRQRVIFVAALNVDPATVLFADDVGPTPDAELADDAHGFYWTEGLRGVGWARDAVPTLKGGSTIGIPSAPAIWLPDAAPGRRFVLPSIEEAEPLQGFPAGWTAPADTGTRRSDRWKLVGNAVTVGVAAWVGGRIVHPGRPGATSVELTAADRWPTAAHGCGGRRWAVDVSMWPQRSPYTHLRDVVDVVSARPLSARAARGFLDRAGRGTLRFADGFLDDLGEHAELMTGGLAVA